MDNISVLIADSRPGLDALADASDLKLIEGTARKFDSLSTYKTPDDVVDGSVDTGAGGWVGLARERGG